jgi:hypothetical protein
MAARRAYRQHLHPDRHPAAHKKAARERIGAAEQSVQAAYARRGMTR